MAETNQDLKQLAGAGAASRDLSLMGCLICLSFCFGATFLASRGFAVSEFGFRVSLTALVAAIFATVSWHGSKIATICLNIYFPANLLLAVVDPPPNSVSPFGVLFVLALCAGVVWSIALLRQQLAYFRFLDKTARPPYGSKYVRDAGTIIVVIITGALIASFQKFVPSSSGALTGSQIQAMSEGEDPDYVISVLEAEGAIPRSGDIEAIYFDSFKPANRSGGIIVNDDVYFFSSRYNAASATNDQKKLNFPLGQICSFGDTAKTSFPLPTRGQSYRIFVQEITGLRPPYKVPFRHVGPAGSESEFITTLRQLNAAAMTAAASSNCKNLLNQLRNNGE